MTTPTIDFDAIAKKNPGVDLERLAQMKAELSASGMKDVFRSEYRLSPPIGGRQEGLDQREGVLLAQRTQRLR